MRGTMRYSSINRINYTWIILLLYCFNCGKMDCELDATHAVELDDGNEVLLAQTSISSKGEIRGIPYDTHYIGQHYLQAKVNEKVSEYSAYAFEDVTNHDAWSVVHQDGDMKVYRREVVDNEGIVLDPLRATHTVKGITAREMTGVFFYPETRMQWEATLDSVQLLEALDDVTIIFRHLHKRIWPAQQRESIFCTHLCVLSDAPKIDYGIGGTYFVMNFSVDHPKAKIEPKLVRVRINISLACQTYTDTPFNGDLSSLKRSNINCRLIYTAEVHPGGWAPANVIRNIGKREVTKFLKKFGTFSVQHVSDKPIDL